MLWEPCGRCEASCAVPCLGPETSRGPQAGGGHLGQKRAAAKGTGSPGQRPGPTCRGGCPRVHDVNVPNTRFFMNSRDPKGRGEGWRSQCQSARHTVILSSFWNMPPGQALGSELYTRYLISSFPWQPHATSSVIIFLLQTRKPGLRMVTQHGQCCPVPKVGPGSHPGTALHVWRREKPQ